MKDISNMTKASSNEEVSLKDDRSIRETEFFTTTELAQKLKMNVQVITRKVKAGEIQAYKIGKDWRIPDQAVTEWLESQTNKPRQTSQATAAAADTGHAKRRHLLEYIMAQLEPNRSYNEAELQKLISRQNKNFEEICCELVAAGMVKRDGKELKRNSEYDLLASN